MASVHNKKTRIAITALHPITYQVGIWQKLNNATNIESTVIFLGDISCKHYRAYSTKSYDTWSSDKAIAPNHTLEDFEGYNFIFSKNLYKDKKYLNGFFRRVNFDILKQLNTKNYDCILIHGYDTFSAILLIVWSKLMGLKIIWRGEAVLSSSDYKFSIKKLIKKLVVNTVMAIADKVLYSCQGNKKLQLFYGVNPKKQQYFNCTINNAEILRQVAIYKPLAATTRKQLKIAPEQIVVTMLGRIAEIKNPMALLKAINLSPHKNKVTVLLIGSGNQIDLVQDYANNNSINLRITGYINPKEIGKYLAIADIGACLSNHDPSPKALNEMMLHKLPIIIYDNVGTAYDLVKKDNGYIIESNNIQKTSYYLDKLLVSTNTRKSFGDKSLEIVKGFNFDVNVNTIQKIALELCDNQQ